MEAGFGDRFVVVAGLSGGDNGSNEEEDGCCWAVIHWCGEDGACKWFEEGCLRLMEMKLGSRFDRVYFNSQFNKGCKIQREEERQKERSL